MSLYFSIFIPENMRYYDYSGSGSVKFWSEIILASGYPVREVAVYFRGISIVT